MSAWDVNGQPLGTSPRLRELQPGEIVKLDIDEVLADIEGDGGRDDILAMLHAVPVDLEASCEVEVATKDLMGHMSASDDFIEFHQKPKGVITGVAYQTGPLNDTRFGTSRTTVVQAPKVIVSDSVDTLFCLMNLAPHFDYADTVEMDFWILGPDGQRIHRAWIEVPPFTFRLVSMTEVLESSGTLEEFRAAGGRGMFLGYSKNGTVVPLSLTRNQQSGAIACDHTLPPIFYLTTWGGEARLNAAAALDREFFSEPREAASVPLYSATASTA